MKRRRRRKDDPCAIGCGICLCLSTQCKHSISMKGPNANQEIANITIQFHEFQENDMSLDFLNYLQNLIQRNNTHLFRLQD